MAKCISYIVVLAVILIFNITAVLQQYEAIGSRDSLRGRGLNSSFSLTNASPNDWEDNVVVSADKMNVFYVGLENPISMASVGIPLSNLEILAEGCGAKVKPAKAMSWGGNYIVTCTNTGSTTLTVCNKETGKTQDFTFRVKSIDVPRVYLGERTEGEINSGTFSAQLGFVARLKAFDIDTFCKITSYTMHYVPKDEDPIIIKGKGGRFEGNVAAALAKAKPGDVFAFTDVRVLLPAATVSRPSNGLHFKII